MTQTSGIPLWRLRATWLIALQAVSLFAFQISSAPVMIHTHTVRYMPPGLFARFLSELPWKTIDLILLAVVFLAFLTILLLEIFTREITGLLKRILGRDRDAAIFTLLSCFVIARGYFAPGKLTWGGDASHHAMHTWIASEGILNGVFPVWTPLVSVGTYFVQYYGSVFAYGSGILASIFGLDWGVKLLLGFAHTVSGFACYLYVRTLTGSRSAGYVAGIVYALSVWHMQLVLVMGRYSAGIVFALLPLPFYYLERLRRGDNHRWAAVAGGLAIGLLTLTHPGYGFWTLCFLAVYVGVLLLGPRTQPRLPGLETAVMLILGLGISAYLVLPMWLEKEWTGLSFGFSMASQGKPSVSHLLVWSNYRTRLTGKPPGDHWYGAYVGLSVLGLVAASGIRRLTRFRYRPSMDLAWIGLGLSLVLTFAYSHTILDFEVVQAMGAARYLVFTAFFAAVLSGCSIKVLRAYWWRRSFVYTAIVTVILIDLGSTTFVQHFHFLPGVEASVMHPELYEAITGPGQRMAQGQYQDERILHGSKPINSYLSVAGRAPSPFGLFEEHPRADRGFVRPLLSRANSVLGYDRSSIQSSLDSDVGELFLAGLRLLNTRHFIHARGSTPVAHLDLDPVMPVLVAGSLTPYNASPLTPVDAFDVIRRMGIDSGGDQCKTLLVSGTKSVDLGTTPGVDLISHDLEIDRATITFRTTAESFCRLSYGYYPHLDVRHNGEPASYFPTAEGFIALRLPAGEHTVTIAGRQTPLRKTIFWIDVLLVAAAVYWARQKRTNETEVR